MTILISFFSKLNILRCFPFLKKCRKEDIQLNIQLLLTFTKTSSRLKWISPQDVKTAGNILNLINNGWGGKCSQKRNKSLCVLKSRKVCQEDRALTENPSPRSTQLGTACFISTSFFYTSRNSLHIWNLEGNISKAKKAFFSSWGLSELFVRSLPGSLVDNHVSWYFYVQKDFGIRSWPLTFCVSWAFLSAWHRFCNVFVLVIFFFKKNQNLSYYPPKCH